MTECQLDVVASVSVVPLLPLAISIAFYRRDEPDPWWRRLAVCSHGAWFFAAVVYAVIACRFSGGYSYGEQNPYELPLLILLALGLASTLASLPFFKGGRWFLLLHLVSLPAAAWITFISAMAISHDWL